MSDAELEAAREVLWSDVEPGSAEYQSALNTLCVAVENGRLEYAGLIAAALAVPGPCHNAKLAYKYYYVSCALQGFRCEWANQALEPGVYHGPIGDFRNEGMVSDLVDENGLALLPELDKQAEGLLAIRARKDGRIH